jgi:hypothetical protein
MERVTLVLKTQKKTGSIRLRFRLRDTNVEIYHKSEISADINDLKKIDIEGKRLPRVTLYNQKLLDDIREEIDLIQKAYKTMIEKGIVITSENWEQEIIKEQEKQNQKKKAKPITPPKVKGEPTLLEKLKNYIAEGKSLNIFGTAREKVYNVMYSILERYLSIKGKSKIHASEFKSNEIKEFYRFIFDEYLYVEEHSELYENLKSSSVPKQARQQNTAANYLKALQAAFRSFEGEHNPFDDLPPKYRTAMLKAEYDEPVCLTRKEFAHIYNMVVTQKLEEVKAVFLLQCAFGCRISDFAKLSMKNVAVADDGIPYLHYLPQKTQRTNSKHEEIETPIMLYALEIIKKWKFDFPILRNISGHSGYNARIKELLQSCNIDRPVKEFDETTNEFVERPLYEVGCNKLCRKTHVNIMNEIQIDKYAAGLHSAGSNAVERYISNSRTQHFILMCAAFEQPIYKVDKDLNIITNN